MKKTQITFSKDVLNVIFIAQSSNFNRKGKAKKGNKPKLKIENIIKSIQTVRLFYSIDPILLCSTVT